MTIISIRAHYTSCLNIPLLSISSASSGILMATTSTMAPYSIPVLDNGRSQPQVPTLSALAGLGGSLTDQLGYLEPLAAGQARKYDNPRTLLVSQSSQCRGAWPSLVISVPASCSGPNAVASAWSIWVMLGTHARIQTSINI